MWWALSCARDESGRTVTARKHKIALRKPHLDRDDETKCDELREQAKAGSGVDAMREGIEARRGEIVDSIGFPNGVSRRPEMGDPV